MNELYRRHGELVDKKFESVLTAEEETELLKIKAALYDQQNAETSKVIEGLESRSKAFQELIQNLESLVSSVEAALPSEK